MKNKLFTVVTLITALAVGQAFALELSEARSSGVVGEKLDGYVAAIVSSPDAAKLVSEVNSKRKAEYTRISKANGEPVDVVAKLAASQVISNLPAGAMYQDSAGNWKKK